jgi:TIR domain
MAREVFVSYSQPDHDCAMELVARVEKEGLNCWIAPRDIAPSSDWAAEIIDAIANSRVMVLVFSSSSNASAQVRREVERAVHKQVSILPFRIENVLPSKSLEYFLSAQHWLDAFPPPREPHYARLVTYLKARLGDIAPPSDTSATQPAPRLVETASFDPGELARVERLLAGYIGPIARHLVKAAAARATSLEQVVQQVVMELETETERHEFTRRWRTGN